MKTPISDMIRENGTTIFMVRGSFVTEWSHYEFQNQSFYCCKPDSASVYNEKEFNALEFDEVFESLFEANKFVVKKSLMADIVSFTYCEFYDEIIEELKQEHPECFL